jgi:CheY-specific phosphatase CheX
MANRRKSRYTDYWNFTIGTVCRRAADGGTMTPGKEKTMQKMWKSVSSPVLLLTWIREALPFLLKKEIPRRSIRRMYGRARADHGEIGMICQFVGDIEGEMTLLASRKTAFSLAATLGADIAGDEIQLLKASLGELTTVLMSKLLARCKEYYKVLRVTTPSCIYGAGLDIRPATEGTSVTAFQTPFGRIAVMISFHSPGQ